MEGWNCKFCTKIEKTSHRKTQNQMVKVYFLKSTLPKKKSNLILIDSLSCILTITKASIFNVLQYLPFFFLTNIFECENFFLLNSMGPFKKIRVKFLHLLRPFPPPVCYFPTPFNTKYWRTSLYVVFLSVNSRICAWKWSFFIEPILYFMVILGLLYANALYARHNLRSVSRI